MPTRRPNFRCAEYEDFRVMLEKEPAIDAVLCATPDHLHAYVSLIAMRAGKHMFCEKPLTHNVWEARRVAQVAKESGVATQMGNIGHSNDGIRVTCEWIWDGAIGPVREVHTWVSANRWNKQLTGRPTETPPVPAGVNWDLWIGPREPRPYHPAYTPVTWRDFWDFGGGGLGDFGCHDLDAACWALDLVAPATVEARPAGNMDRDIAPHGELCYYDFGPRGDKPAVRVTWYDGGLQPPCPEELPRGSTLPTRGALFIGDQGKMLCDGAGGMPRLLPYEKTAAYQKPAASIPRSKGHHRDWLDACKGGPPASANFEYGARLTELALLGIASLRTGKKIYWDAANMQAAERRKSMPCLRNPIAQVGNLPEDRSARAKPRVAATRCRSSVSRPSREGFLERFQHFLFVGRDFVAVSQNAPGGLSHPAGPLEHVVLQLLDFRLVELPAQRGNVMLPRV